MAKEIAEQVVNFRLSADEVARVDRLAAKIGNTRAQMLRNLISVGLDEAEMFEKVGIIRMGITVRDVIGWLGEKRKNLVENVEDETPLTGKK